MLITARYDNRMRRWRPDGPAADQHTRVGIAALVNWVIGSATCGLGLLGQTIPAVLASGVWMLALIYYIWPVLRRRVAPRQRPTSRRTSRLRSRR